MNQLHTLSQHRPLPMHLQEIIQANDWPSLIRAFEDGLSPNLVYENDQTLFGTITYVLSEIGPANTTSAAYGPLALVQAFIRHGLSDILAPPHVTSIVDVCASGQWAWLDPLLAAAHRVELPGGRSVLHALVEGRMARRLRGLEDQWDEDESRVREFKFNMDTAAEVAQVHHVVATLVDRGAKVEALDDEGGTEVPFTPLMLAVQYNDRVAAEALLHAGAQVGFDPGEDPMGINQHHPFALAALCGLDRMLDLLMSHAGLDAMAHHGVDAMHLAAARGHVDCMKVLNAHGIDYCVPTRTGAYTSLHQAALHGQSEVIDLLLENGAQWNAGQSDGLSAGQVLEQHHPALSRHYRVPGVKGNVVPLKILGRGVAKKT